MRDSWTDHGEILPPGVVEDFRIVQEGDGYAAYFVAGNHFQNLRLFRAPVTGPLGPVTGPWERVGVNKYAAHTRLYSGRVDEKRRIITAVWPGLPRAGLWLFTEEPFGMTKRLFIAPKESTGYSVAAANPAVAEFAPGRWEIFFEGRAEVVRWDIFRATWDGTHPPVVEDQPFLQGAANPSLVVHGPRAYLYYSKHEGALFSTRVASRAL